MSKRSIVHIDGFNFYYGLVKNSPYKWLDLESYFKRLRQDDEIQKIWYFTARIKGKRLPNQTTYLEAISACCPLVEVKYGLFKEKKVSCRVSSCTHSSSRSYSVPEEKGTDVNIAVQMLDDVYQNLCERIILVSGDSDLVPALELVKRRSSKTEVIVYVPTRNPKRSAATELRKVADKVNILSSTVLVSRSQFPDSIPTNTNKIIAKPKDW